MSLLYSRFVWCIEFQSRRRIRPSPTGFRQIFSLQSCADRPWKQRPISHLSCISRRGGGRGEGILLEDPLARLRLVHVGDEVTEGGVIARAHPGHLHPQLLPDDEAVGCLLLGALDAAGLDLVLLAAPTTPPERLARIAERTRGFLYFVSITGVTGGGAELPEELPGMLARAKQVSRVPVAVGFGVSRPEQARLLAPHADGVVVGTAIVREIQRAAGATEAVAALVRSLRQAL